VIPSGIVAPQSCAKYISLLEIMQIAFLYSRANMTVILFAQRQLKACDVKAVQPKH
jgi:hypothetical protein